MTCRLSIALTVFQACSRLCLATSYSCSEVLSCTGVGLEVVRSLDQHGFTVLMGTRSKSAGEAAVAELAPCGDIRVLELDVTADASVAAAAQEVQRCFGHLDVLVSLPEMSPRFFPPFLLEK